MATLQTRSEGRGGHTIGRVGLISTATLVETSSADVDVGSADFIATENPRPHVAFGSDSLLHVASGACHRVSMGSPDLAVMGSVDEDCTPANRYIQTSSPAATAGAYAAFDGSIEVFAGTELRPQRFAQLPVNEAELLSISRDADRVAVARSGAIFVTSTSLEPSDDVAVRLDGASGIAAVEFLAGRRLVSAGDGGVQLWDASAPGALVRRTDVRTPDVVGFIDSPIG